MAFSENIVNIYKDTGYKSILLDYENSILAEKINKNHNLKFNCIKVIYKKKMNIVFGSSFLFQQFQNCVYGDISFNKYLEIIKKYRKEKKILYSNI